MFIRLIKLFLLLICLLILLNGCADNKNHLLNNKDNEFITTYENISLEEALYKISFDIKLPTYLPYKVEKIYSDVDILNENGEQIVVHYEKNNNYGNHYLHIIADNVIPATYSTKPYYSEGNYYQSLVWIDNGINYRLIYFTGDVNEGQQPLSKEELMKIVESMK